MTRESPTTTESGTLFVPANNTDNAAGATRLRYPADDEDPLMAPAWTATEAVWPSVQDIVVIVIRRFYFR